MRHDNAAARVRKRIAEWVEQQGRGSRKKIAGAVLGLYGKKRSASWVTDITDGPEQGGQDLRLQDLDGVAEAMGIPPGDLVRRDGDHYVEVNATELRLLRFTRSLPDTARHHLGAYFDYIFSIQEKLLEQQARERDEKTAAARRARQELRATKRKHGT